MLVINGRRLGAHKRLIDRDLYNIAARIREIDDGYRVVFDTKLNRFEVWHTRSRSITPELVLPYKELDARTLSRTRLTLHRCSEWGE